MHPDSYLPEARPAFGRVWVVVLLLCGCGGDPVRAPVERAASEETSAEGSAPGVGATPSPPPPVAAEGAPPWTLPLGPLALLVERCGVAGPPLFAADALDAIRSITWSGADVWVIDGAGSVRHYVDVGDEACALLHQRDLTFGAALSDSPRWLSTDGQGHLYVSSASTTLRLTDGVVDYACAVGGRLAVSPSGAHGFVVFGSGPAQRIDFGAEACEVSAWAPSEAPSILESISFVSDDRVLVGGQRGREGAHVVRPYDLEGQPLGPALGSTDASAMERLCYVHAAWACGDGTCVLDGNCRTLLWLDAAWSAEARLDVHALTRLWAPWVVPPTRVEHGMTFFAASQPEVDEAGGRRFAGSIYRLHGL